MPSSFKKYFDPVSKMFIMVIMITTFLSFGLMFAALFLSPNVCVVSDPRAETVWNLALAIVFGTITLCAPLSLGNVLYIFYKMIWSHSQKDVPESFPFICCLCFFSFFVTLQLPLNFAIHVIGGTIFGIVLIIWDSVHDPAHASDSP